MLRTELKNALRQVLDDPIVQILVENANLTKIQFETLLIDILSQQLVGRGHSIDDKTTLRWNRKGLTRGAFNRTLDQARRNTVRSIYTLFLLGYTGLFDSPKLEPFIEAGNQIKSYAEETKSFGSTSDPRARVRAADMQQTLKETLHVLAKRLSFREAL